MRSFDGFSRRAGASAVLAIAAGATTASGTVLTFDLGPSALAPNGTSITNNFQGYGDRVGGQAQPPQFSYGTGGGITPNVQTRYGSGIRYAFSAPRDPAHQYGDLENVVYRDKSDFSGGNNTKLVVSLTADPGFLVCLFSFDVALLLGESLPIASVTITDGTSKVLFSDSSADVPDTTPPSHKSYTFDGSDPLKHPLIKAQDVEIILDFSAVLSKIERFGVDNIKFGQTLPTPGAAAALFTGFGLLGTRRRRG